MNIPPLSRHALERDHAGRMLEGAVESALADPTTRIVLIHGDRTVMAGSRIVRFTSAEIPAGARLSWLGRTTTDGDVPKGSIVLAAHVAEASAEGVWSDLRAVGAELADDDAGILTQAVALGQWHASHGFSPVDGSAVAFEDAGWVGRDGAGTQHFPRIDPAVITLVISDDDERILLGRNAAWKDRFSLFAGFVDPGESLESAVVREVKEEAGVTVADPTYIASQPWPYPRSLMLGFEAVATDPERAEPDGEEIVEIRWLTRDDVRAKVVGLPSGSSIAAFLIARWLAR